jgi:hypothetical protein
MRSNSRRRGWMCSSWLRGETKERVALNGQNEKLSVAWINETVHFLFSSQLSRVKERKKKNCWKETLLLCTLLIKTMKQKRRRKHTTMECLSAPTRNCGRKDIYLWNIKKHFIRIKRWERSWKVNGKRLLDLNTQQKDRRQRRSFLRVKLSDKASTEKILNWKLC